HYVARHQVSREDLTGYGALGTLGNAPLGKPSNAVRVELVNGCRPGQLGLGHPAAHLGFAAAVTFAMADFGFREGAIQGAHITDPLPRTTGAVSQYLGQLHLALAIHVLLLSLR